MNRALRVVSAAFKCVLASVMGLLLLYNGYILVSKYAFGNDMPTVFGYGGAVVVSGSMEPYLCVNDFIITKSQNSYSMGDVIMFYDGTKREYITHRITYASGGVYATQGDANNAPDPFSVPHAAVVGKVVSVWRGFGKAVRFMQSPAGFFSVIVAGTVLWWGADLIRGIKGKKRDEKREKN